MRRLVASGAQLFLSFLRSVKERVARSEAILRSAEAEGRSLSAEDVGELFRHAHTIKGEARGEGLRDLGYVEGKNLVIEWRFADGNTERLPALAAELVRQKVDIIVATGAPAASAAQKSTATIPIVIETSAPST